MLVRAFASHFFSTITSAAFFLFSMGVASSAHSALAPLSDKDMSAVTGQALINSDVIVGSTTDSNPYNNFVFYRAGLDVQLALNANIDEFKLGCGGSNDAIDASVCDIDMDYVRLMGNCTGTGCGQTSPDGYSIPGSGDAATSDFLLTRPYLEFAIKNDGDKTLREIVGIKVGSQSANGYFGVGNVNCRGNDPNCHGGLNAISGYLNIELSTEVPMTVGAFGDTVGCIGWVRVSGPCDGTNAGDAYYLDNARTTGTRMTYLQQTSIPVELEGGFVSILGSAYANMVEKLSFVHGFELQNTGDFFLSLQRERVSYPTYDKSGYAVTANTGWWMNVPDVKAINIQTPHVNIPCGFFGCLGALGTPGVVVENIELNSSPPDNCFGNTLFC